MFTFSSITSDDIPLIHKWFNEPHVQKFYSLHPWTEEQARKKLEPKPFLSQFIVYQGLVPFGYLQSYPVQEFPWKELSLDDEMFKNAAGIDFFIGDPSFLGKGLGQAMILQFLEEKIWPNYTYCLADPDVRNESSLRMLKACGFRPFEKIHSKDTLGRPVELWIYSKRRPFARG